MSAWEDQFEHDQHKLAQFHGHHYRQPRSPVRRCPHCGESKRGLKEHIEAKHPETIPGLERRNAGRDLLKALRTVLPLAMAYGKIAGPLHLVPAVEKAIEFLEQEMEDKS